MGITVQQVGVLTCASRLCLRSFSIHRQLLDIELYCNQPLQVSTRTDLQEVPRQIPCRGVTSQAVLESLQDCSPQA